ncbi:MAG: hypothetical protein IJD21_06880 [Oscillospiraceae bacterium]|nr:hypothetical protein [Oscillospiraceae bacterium]
MPKQKKQAGKKRLVPRGLLAGVAAGLGSSLLMLLLAALLISAGAVEEGRGELLSLVSVALGGATAGLTAGRLAKQRRLLTAAASGGILLVLWFLLGSEAALCGNAEAGLVSTVLLIPVFTGGIIASLTAKGNR